MKAPWFASYEPGIPHEIPPIAYKSLADFCDKICTQFAEKPAFSNFGTTITYKQFDHRSKALAAYLRHELKLQPGDRVAIMLPNTLQYPVSLFGILRAGLVAVNVNPQYTPPELLHELQDADAKAIIVWDGAAHILQEVLPSLKHLQVITTELGDLMPPSKRMVIQFVLKWVKRQIKHWNIPSAKSFRDVMIKGSEMPAPQVNIDLEDIAFLQYTGGTTGVPKGAMLTHHNMLANLSQAQTWTQHIFKPGKEMTGISPLPFYHVFSLLANCLLLMSLGSFNILITDPRDINGLIKTLKKQPFHFISGVNTLFNALLQHPAISSVDFKPLEVSLGGGMAVQRTVAEGWHKLTGKILYVGYGLTETSPAVSISPLNQKEFNESIGLPIPSTDVEIRDDKEKVLDINQEGEIWVKGPQVMKGYWKKAEETQKVFDKNGWLRTGDIGKIDDKGFLYLLDRKKDMIKVSGFNVYPNEIEDLVVKCSGVLEAAAIGVPDEHSGEVIKLFVVKKDSSLTEESIRKCCHDNLTGYKRPKEIEFRDHLPKSNVGKILRRELRDEAGLSKKV